MQPQARKDAGVPPAAIEITDQAMRDLVEEYARQVNVLLFRCNHHTKPVLPSFSSLERIMRLFSIVQSLRLRISRLGAEAVATGLSS